MRRLSPNIVRKIEVQYDLKDVLEVLRRSGKVRLHESRNVPLSVVDQFLYSGRMNSVLGPEGFTIFKDKVKGVLKRVNEDDFGLNYINLDEMFEALLDSGVYYVDRYLPEELEFLRADQRWLTAYRYIAKNFPGIGYRDFRAIIRRFEESKGYAFFVDPEDSELLRSVAKQSELFKKVVDAKAALLQLGSKGLKTICAQLGIQAARSLADTADRIIAAAGDGVVNLLPKEVAARQALVIKDQELATGEDLIQLDKYLRVISKVVREDLASFIGDRRKGLMHVSIGGQ